MLVPVKPYRVADYVVRNGVFLFARLITLFKFSRADVASVRVDHRSFETIFARVKQLSKEEEGAKHWWRRHRENDAGNRRNRGRGRRGDIMSQLVRTGLTFTIGNSEKPGHNIARLFR